MLDVTLIQTNMGGMDVAVFPYDDGSVSGNLVNAPHLSPSENGVVIYFNVNGIMDAAIKRATAKGAKIVQEKIHIGNPGYIALIIDSEGNKIGLHSTSE